MISNMSGDWFMTPLYWFALAYAVASDGHVARAVATGAYRDARAAVTQLPQGARYPPQ